VLVVAWSSGRQAVSMMSSILLSLGSSVCRSSCRNRMTGIEETRGGMAGDLGLDPVVVVSHSEGSVGCRVIVLAKRSAGHQSDRRLLAFKAKPY
jgi:hypothetical protein